MNTEEKVEILLTQMIMHVIENPGQPSYHFLFSDLVGEEERRLARLAGGAVSVQFCVPVLVTLANGEMQA